MKEAEAGEVSAESYKIEEFCLSRGVDKQRAMLSGLAMEEMAGNVVTHGFRADSKPHSADIRVTCNGEDMISEAEGQLHSVHPF
ncbi:MAG: hypothetical protein IJP54_01470 [Synergistaceae bacterium]|nr:hypothetical protein [Synergistaceae bacterium]